MKQITKDQAVDMIESQIKTKRRSAIVLTVLSMSLLTYSLFTMARTVNIDTFAAHVMVSLISLLASAVGIIGLAESE